MNDESNSRISVSVGLLTIVSKSIFFNFEINHRRPLFVRLNDVASEMHAIYVKQILLVMSITTHVYLQLVMG